MDYLHIRKNIEAFSKDDYKSFIKALISFEKNIYNESLLDEIYVQFMDRDNMGLLNENFDCLISNIKLDHFKSV